MQDRAQTGPASRAVPFDTDKLDTLMEEAGIDVLLATSKHNVQYLLDAERAIFFDYMDALGVSRYLPILIYPKGAPEKAGYVGNPLEAHQRAVVPLWAPEVQYKSMGSVDAINRAVEIVKKSGVPAQAYWCRDGVSANGRRQGPLLRVCGQRDKGRAVRA